MNPGIFIIQGNDELVEMNEQAYDSENLLQTLLAKYPTLLAGSQIDAKAPRKWLLIGREFGVPSEEGGADQGSLDHLFLDQDAIPTIVEVKRSTNTTIRREIVGQMLDYAANAVVYWPVDRIRSRFEANCEREGSDPEKKLRDCLDLEVEPEEFWQKANTNLQAGRVRLLFIADEIPTKLQRIVEFLNEQMNPAEVLAVEIKQFVGQGSRGLVPRVIGQTAEAQQKKLTGSSASRRWDEASFLQAIEEQTGFEEAEITRKIFAWSRQNMSRITWAKTSFSVVLDYGAESSYTPFLVYAHGKPRGRIEMPFKGMGKNPPFNTEEKRLELLRRLNEIPEVNLLNDSINRYPTFSLSALGNANALEQFFQTIGWTFEKVKAARQTLPDLRSQSAKS